MGVKFAFRKCGCGEWLFGGRSTQRCSARIKVRLREVRRDWLSLRDKCSVDGCETPIHARALCLKHYARWRKYKNASQDFLIARRLECSKATRLKRMRSCIACGKEFESSKSTSTQKYCSRECFQPTPWKISKDCPQCGKTFVPRKGCYTTYCSRLCASVENLKKGTFVAANIRRRRPQSSVKYLECFSCSNMFTFHSPSNISTKFCSEDCREASRKPTRFLKTCPACGGDFIGKKNAKCCSQKCYRETYKANNYEAYISERRSYRERNLLEITSKKRAYDKKVRVAYNALLEMGLVPRGKDKYGPAALRLARELNLIEITGETDGT